MDEIEHTLDTIYCISCRVSIYKNKVYDHNKCLYCENTTIKTMYPKLFEVFTPSRVIIILYRSDDKVSFHLSIPSLPFVPPGKTFPTRNTHQANNSL